MGRDRLGQLGEHRQEQHRHGGGQADDVVHHHAEQVEGDGGEARGGDGGDVHGAAGLALHALALGVHVVVLARLQPAVAGEVGHALADIVERAGEQDRREAAEHDRRQDLGEEVALVQAEDRGVADRERDRALADAAGHDRHHDEEEGLVGAETERHADQGADAGRRDRADGQGHEDLEEAADQDLTVHAEDRADDDRGDVQVEEVGELGEVDDRLLDLRRDHAVIGERRGDEGREDRARPDGAQHRQALADLGAGEAAEHEHRDHRRRVGLDLALEGQDRQERDEDEIDRDRDDADLEVHQTPPALGPERLARRFRRRGDGARRVQLNRSCGVGVHQVSSRIASSPAAGSPLLALLNVLVMPPL